MRSRPSYSRARAPPLTHAAATARRSYPTKGHNLKGPNSREVAWAVFFHRPYCGACRRVRPFFEALAETTNHPDKLRFGHRGVNQPVLRREDHTVEITSHNHGFAVRAESLGRALGEHRYETAAHGTVTTMSSSSGALAGWSNFPMATRTPSGMFSTWRQ